LVPHEVFLARLVGNTIKSFNITAIFKAALSMYEQATEGS
jgi:hypothetical protein